MEKKIILKVTREELYSVLFTLKFIAGSIDILKLPLPEFIFTRSFYFRARNLWNYSSPKKKIFYLTISELELEQLHIFSWGRGSFLIYNQKELNTFIEFKQTAKNEFKKITSKK